MINIKHTLMLINALQVIVIIILNLILMEICMDNAYVMTAIIMIIRLISINYKTKIF